MSLVVKEVLAHSHDLGKNERLVLLTLAAHANEHGDAWPSVATIAKYVGCSERTVQRILAKLVELGRLAMRQVKRIATRIYRIVTPGATTDEDRAPVRPIEATNQRDRGDARELSPEVEDHLKTMKPWRQFLPKKHPDRRGAALPPAPGVARCSVHRGSLAHNCGGCRVDALVGAR